MRIFVAFIARHIQQREHAGLELRLLLRKRFFAGFDLGIGDLFNLFQHLGRAHALRQLGHNQLPLPARQLFDLPACANLKRAPPTAVGLGNIRRRADDLAAVGKVWPWHQGEQLFVGEFGVFDQCYGGLRDLVQVVTGDFRGQTDGNAAGTIEQIKRQTGGQQARLALRPIVIGHEIDRSHVNFICQQRGNFCQPGFGVAHGGG